MNLRRPIHHTAIITPLFAFMATFTSVATAEQIQSPMPANLNNLTIPSETIVVFGNKHQHASAPVGQSTFIDIADITPAVSNLSQLIANIPGADINGQQAILFHMHVTGKGHAVFDDFGPQATVFGYMFQKREVFNLAGIPLYGKELLGIR